MPIPFNPTDLLPARPILSSLTRSGLLSDGDEPLEEEGVALECLLVGTVGGMVGWVLGGAGVVEFGGEAWVKRGGEEKKEKEGGKKAGTGGGKGVNACSSERPELQDS